MKGGWIMSDLKLDFKKATEAIQKQAQPTTKPKAKPKTKETVAEISKDKKTEEVKPKEVSKQKEVIGITTTRLNKRVAPNLDAKVAAILEKGWEVVILEDHGEWSKVEGGYVMSKFLKKA